MRHQRVRYSSHFDLNWTQTLTFWPAIEYRFPAPRQVPAFELPVNFSASAIPVPHHRIIITQLCLRMYHFHIIYPCHCYNNCCRHRRHYSHRHPYHLCHRNKKNQQLATNAILPTRAIDIADKIASKIAENIETCEWTFTYAVTIYFLFLSDPFNFRARLFLVFFAQPSPQLFNGPSLIDILFLIYKGFTFTTKKDDAVYI